MASSEDNKATVRDFFACATRGEFDRFEALIRSDYVLHDTAGDARGVEGVKERVEGYRSGIAGLRVTVEQQLAAGDLVATRYTCRGTHEGELMGAAATGREVAINGIVISRFVGGQVAEEWEVADVFGLLRQIGLIPELVRS
jgi:predicted ester cyclase